MSSPRRNPHHLTAIACVVGLLSASLPGQDASQAQSQAVAAEVTVDASQAREPISPYIYGQFIEHLGRCIYGGIWAEMLEDRKFYFPVPAPGEIWRETREHARVLAASPWKVMGPASAVRMVAQDAFVGAHSPALEAPGDGTTVGLYQEELGLTKGRAYTGYIFLNGDSSAAPVAVSLSWGSGDHENEVAIIKKPGPKYAKVPFKFIAGADTDHGRLTISTSGKGKLSIGWQLGYMQLNHYVLKHNWVEEKMRQVDPSIKTVGSGEAGPWSRGMLTNCADHMNLISEHFYVFRTNDDVVAHVQLIPNNIKRIADAHRQYRKEISSLQGKDIRITMDEWNYWYGPHVFGELGTRYFLKDALGIAAGLHEYFRNTDVIFMANYAQTVNVIGCIKTTKTHAEFDATGLALMLYRRHFGTIPVQVTQQAAPLDISAALTSERSALTIGIVNPKAESVPLKLNFASIKPSGRAQAWTIAGNDPLAFNQPGEPRRVDIQETAPVDLTGTVSVKPFSITLWRVPVKQARADRPSRRFQRASFAGRSRVNLAKVQSTHLGS